MTAPAPAPAPAKAPSVKKSKKVVESEGIAHISATFNNVLITITDMRGNTIAWGTAGKAGFKGSKKSTPFAATVAAENVGREAMNMGVRKLHVLVQGPGSGRESAIQALASAPNQKVLMLPIEASALIGSLAGIAEIAKATFGPDGRAPSSTPGAPTTQRRPTVPTT